MSTIRRTTEALRKTDLQATETYEFDPTCPRCQHVFSDGWELQDDVTYRRECSKCDTVVTITPTSFRRYTTKVL